MFSDKRNILQLAALLKAHGIHKVVLCPGARNAAIVQTLSNVDGFTCYAMTDVRSAGFFAIGLSMQGGETAAVCCDAGSSLANLYPAVAEAARQQIPVIVISADQPTTCGGMTEPYSIPQHQPFGQLVKLSVTLPEITTDEEEAHCNRMVNEAILETRHHGNGPVHINVPVAEPMYRFTAKELPDVRIVTRYQGLSLYDRDYNDLIDKLNKYNRRMVVAGQMSLIYLYDKQYEKPLTKQFAWLTEHLGNKTVPGTPIRNFDSAISSMNEDRLITMKPELLITFGGQVVSKQLRKYFKNYPPKEHWHVSQDGKLTDPFGIQTTVIEMNPFEFFEKVIRLMDGKPTNFPLMWENYCRIIAPPAFPYTQMAVIGKLMQSLPANCALHLANGSAVRYAQLFPLTPDIEVCGNQGTGGIEGCLSTAIGYATASTKLNFIVIGDLSFFTDMNALWCRHIRPNVRILLLNNGGAEGFHTLPGMDKGSHSAPYLTAAHQTSARAWAEERGFTYLMVKDGDELDDIVQLFTAPEEKEHPLLLEAFTDQERDTTELRSYYRKIKEEHKD